ncbi:metallophosphoesterase [Deinococcus radiotolerans]|uniref:Serine/threonine phosphatase n=1 Tax=Deinococcus radiotolerans TaxID=1309407 RepID=A0ABQ2FIX6_9DEIO|nr:metallophosphoesterase [Deinococcus radiotolerans]GGL02111.1 serine/threonine phosphatase [Deinococcus radiotolerans]
MTLTAAPDVIELPALALVLLAGVPGSGRRAFAARHFTPGEVFDAHAFQEPADLHAAVAAQLAAGELAVVIAPATRPAERAPWSALAREHDVKAVAVLLDEERAVLEARTANSLSREELIAQVSELRRTAGGLRAEGFRQAWHLRGAQIARVGVRRVPLRVDRRDLHGPFDLIGDVHGCLNELRELLACLGYAVQGDTMTPPAGRTAIFLGDLTDRGPDSAGVLRLVMTMVASGAALCVMGNHDEKLLRALSGKAVKAMHGLDVTLAQLDAAGPAFQGQVRAFLEGLPAHLVLDGGQLIAAHGGLPAHLHGRGSGRARSFALYGDTTGAYDELGLPVRRDWAAGYAGAPLVAYGHTPHATPRWVGNTVNIDTGCAFGGALTALRYPERETLSVPARAVYAQPPRPLPPGQPPLA